MRHLQSFSDALLESMLLESVLYFSPVFREKLQGLDNGIAKNLLELEGTDVDSDVTFIDSLPNDLGKVTFISMNQAIQKLKVAYPGDEAADLQQNPDVKLNDIVFDRESNLNFRSSNRYTGIYSRTRNSIKLGKFVNKVFKGSFSDAEVEDFVNQFKSASDKYKLEVKLVSGHEITKWYKSENLFSKTGSLGQSCMLDANYFEIYEQNPEVCQLAIVLKDGKLVSRALVWKVESDNPQITTYVDRIYSCKDYYDYILSDWADSNKFAKWKRGELEAVNFLGKELYPQMKVKVKKLKYENYPYLDTFRRYDYVKGYLYNDATGYKRGDILASTMGSKSSRNYRSKIQKLGDFFGIGENLNQSSL